MASLLYRLFVDCKEQAALPPYLIKPKLLSVLVLLKVAKADKHTICHVLQDSSDIFDSDTAECRTLGQFGHSGKPEPNEQFIYQLQMTSVSSYCTAHAQLELYLNLALHSDKMLHANTGQHINTTHCRTAFVFCYP